MWFKTKERLPISGILVMAKNPFCEAVSWICGANDTGNAAWCHKGGWKHADDFVSDWRFLNEDEIATL